MHLSLPTQAAQHAASPVPTGEHAHTLFGHVAESGWEASDFGAIYQWLAEGGREGGREGEGTEGAKR